MKARKGFTLVEILIVVVILGILAAIVIPQFTSASTEAKTSSLVTDLQSARSQIQLFKVQHNDNIPSVANGTFVAKPFKDSMTLKTDIFGNTYALTATVSATGDSLYGPYLAKLPTNQFVDSNDVQPGNYAGAPPAPITDGSRGWFYDLDTGSFWACDSAEHSLL